MVVQHNLSAMNANRMYNLTQASLSSSTEKLSSGYKINSAADDAAGLSISEKMRKQIRGLTQASSNAEDGISAVQTAEGALSEVTDMLQRMNELAVKAANGTNSESDRQTIQDEIDQLTTEIDRVSETTKFNETYLLKGNTDGTSSSVTVNAHDAGLDGKLVDNGNGTATFTLNTELKEGDTVTIGGTDYTIGTSSDSTDGYAKYDDTKTKAVSFGDSITVDGTTSTLVNKIAVDKIASLENDSKFTIVDEDGNSTEYTIADTTDLDSGEISAADAKTLISNSMASAHSITVTNFNDGTNNLASSFEVVSALGTNEVSGADSNLIDTATGNWDYTVDNLNKAANSGTAGTATDVTISGNTTTFTTNTPISDSAITSVVSKMATGDKITIGTTEYTISDETDARNDKYTKEDVLALINQGSNTLDTVKFDIDAANTAGTKALTENGLVNSDEYTAVGTPSSVTSSSSNTITVADAYSKMAEELAKASSIGADNAATVTDDGNGKFTITQGTVDVKNSLNFSLHVGADANMTNKINVSIDSMSAAGLGVKGINVADSTGISGTYAVDAIEDAINKVSAQRSALGAIQNRLEHTINNLDNVVENTTSAESQIRDTDMATEMVKYSNANILSQAGQSMLAQANQSNQGVLSLLG
jgi:flagellin-like hook-associated protein FlgL